MISENTSSCHRYEIDVSAIPGEWWLTDPWAADTRPSGDLTNEQHPLNSLTTTGSYISAWRLRGEQRNFLPSE